MKAHLIFMKDISSISFLARLQLTDSINRIHKGAVMLALPHYVSYSLTNALNSCMCDEKTCMTASIRGNDARSQKLLRSHHEVNSSYLKKSTPDQDITDFDTSKLDGIQPSNTTPQSYADNMDIESFTTVDKNEEGTSIYISRARVDVFVPRSRRHCCAWNLPADITRLAFQAKFLQSIQIRATSSTCNNQINIISSKPLGQNRALAWVPRIGVCIKTNSRFRSSTRQSSVPVVLHIYTLNTTTTVNSVRSSSSNAVRKSFFVRILMTHGI